MWIWIPGQFFAPSWQLWPTLRGAGAGRFRSSSPVLRGHGERLSELGQTFPDGGCMSVTLNAWVAGYGAATAAASGARTLRMERPSLASPIAPSTSGVTYEAA